MCGEKYIGETKRNGEIRWMEHNTPSNKSNLFAWKFICHACNRKLARKMLEVCFIATMKS